MIIINGFESNGLLWSVTKDSITLYEKDDDSYLDISLHFDNDARETLKTMLEDKSITIDEENGQYKTFYCKGIQYEEPLIKEGFYAWSMEVNNNGTISNELIPLTETELNTLSQLLNNNVEV